ncbi:MAG: hypothetical protein K2G55_21635 [Lachnospiraceae bacterium]|nr:hypothetical protein [Lachnospiraceae bacterium]
MAERTLGDLCSREREMLYHLELDMPDEWEKSFDFTYKERGSYYMLQDKHEYLMEYGFETLPQLKETLDRLWENEQYMQDIKKTVLAAAIKNKPKQEESVYAEKDTHGHMPEFIIYNF